MTTPYSAQPAGRPSAGPEAQAHEATGDGPAGAGGPDPTGPGGLNGHNGSGGLDGLAGPGALGGLGGLGAPGSEWAGGNSGWAGGPVGWPSYTDVTGGAMPTGPRGTPSGWEPLVGGDDAPPPMSSVGLPPPGFPPPGGPPPAEPPSPGPGGGGQSSDAGAPVGAPPDIVPLAGLIPGPPPAVAPPAGGNTPPPVPPPGESTAPAPPPTVAAPPSSEFPSSEFPPPVPFPGGQAATGQESGGPGQPGSMASASSDGERGFPGDLGPGFAVTPGFPPGRPPHGPASSDFGTPWGVPPLEPDSGAGPGPGGAGDAGGAGGAGAAGASGAGPDGPVPVGSSHPGGGGAPEDADAAGAALREALFDQAPVGLALYDAAGRYLRVNDVLARLNGRPAAEHLGRTMAELLGEIGQEMDGLLSRVLRTGEAVTDLEIGVATGGAGPNQTWSASWYPATDRLGARAGAVLVALDATRAKTAERDHTRAVARERALGEATAADVFHAGGDGALDTDLPRWRAATGQSGAQAAGFGWLDAIGPDDRERVARAWHGAIERREPFDTEFGVPDVTGAHRTITARLVPVVDGPQVEWIGVLADVTDARSVREPRAAQGDPADEATWRREQSWRLTSALGRAVTVDDVVAVVLDSGGRAARAVGRGVALIDESDDRLRFRSLVGTSAQYAERWSEVGLGAIHPLAEVIRGRRALFLRSRDELSGRWPVADLLGAVEPGPEHAWALLPLATTDVPFGVLHLGFPSPREFDPDDQAFLMAMAEQCAQALERATLFERLAADTARSRRDRDEAEAELTAALAAADVQQSAAGAARRRLEQLARAGEAVASATSPERALVALATAVAGEIADVCVIHLLPPADEAETSAASGASGRPASPTALALPGARPAVFAARDGLTAAAPPGAPALVLPGAGPLAEVAAGADPVLLPARTDLPFLDGFLDGALTPELARWVRGVEGHSAAAVPITFRGRPAGVLTVIAAGERPAFTADDLPFLTEVAARTAPALERAEAGGRDGGDALALQRALLPRTPAPAGLDLATRYLPAGEDDQVGGDWFDVIDLGAGRVALVIGDVMGRGVRAAALMGQLRSAARTCARLDLPPAEVLIQLDGLVADLAEDLIATCIYAVVETDTGQLTLASAGHPPPLVVAPDGLVSRLYMAAATPLGLACDAMTEYTVALGPGSLLALFTDGLVRGRDLDIDAGVSNLAAVLARPAEEWDGRLDDLARAACAARVGVGGPPPGDDVALLLARLPVPDPLAEPLDVSADPSVGLSQVRAQVRVALENALIEPPVIDTVVLVLSELVGNALLHGRAPLSVRVRRLAAAGAVGVGAVGGGVRRILVEVGDAGGRMPRRRRAGPDDETGRGLDLVGRLALRWGVRPVGDGKLVWAEIDPSRV
ncbi:SpoIIE family protein phosphatase [Parafrankia discariae]|uniref:SpoIIE family protein phosphatase n=1 Tax=Parafrankia discariae TaxID=365528 RepID=UPI00037C8431|nr:SpoIIE family protein phosphatase [Parafrankia discariae]